MPRRIPRHSTGRRPLLDAAMHNLIVDLIAAGNYLSTAAEAAGIGESTLRQWIALGRAAQEAEAQGERLAPSADSYAAFAAALTRARARVEVELISVVRRVIAGGTVIKEEPVVTRDGSPVYDQDGKLAYRRAFTPPDGRLALEYLARTGPERWARRPTGEVPREVPDLDVEPDRPPAQVIRIHARLRELVAAAQSSPAQGAVEGPKGDPEPAL